MTAARRPPRSGSGRVLETVTNQSSRVPDHPGVRLVDARPGLGEPAPTPHPHPDHPHDVRRGREPDRDRRRRCWWSPSPSRRPASSTQTSAGSPSSRSPSTSLRRVRRRRHLGHQPGDRQRALGDRRAQADPEGPAQHVLRAVATDPRAADPLGRRHDRADHDVRPRGHQLHPEVACWASASPASSSPRAATCSPSSHCVRSPRRRWRPATSAAVRRGPHGSHHARLGARLWRPGARHPAGRDHHVDAAKHDADPVHGRRR